MIANCATCNRMVTNDKIRRKCSVCGKDMCKTCLPFPNAKVCKECDQRMKDEHWSNV